MMGIVIPNAVNRFDEVFASVRDKNYLTALELAALIDNRIHEADHKDAVEFLANLGIYVKNDDEDRVVRQAVEIIKLAWSPEVMQA